MMHLDEYMKTIDVPKFESVLRQLAAENPDFRYIELDAGAADCRYDGPAIGSDGKVIGNPCSGCIFGQAFHQEGVTEGLDTDEGIFKIAKNLPNLKKYQWIGLQSAQDSGDTWGEAIKQLGEKEHQELQAWIAQSEENQSKQKLYPFFFFSILLQ